MAKTLVIKGANFSENKIETVTFVNSVPCTGISLAEQSASVIYGGTYTPVVTLTPSNTTDAVVWTSNNANFTISNGVVSVGGVGEATITVTCGSHTASVVLTAVATFDADDFDVASNMGLDYTSDYCSLIKGSDRYSLGRVSETGYHTLWSDAETQAVGLTFCPCIIPPGSSSMKVTYSSSYGTKVGFADMSTQSSIGYGAVKIVDHDSSGIASASRTLTIPSDADGFYISVYNSDTTALEIEFS